MPSLMRRRSVGCPTSRHANGECESISVFTLPPTTKNDNPNNHAHPIPTHHVGARKLLLLGVENLPEGSPGRRRLDAYLGFGDVDEQVYQAWCAKEWTRDMYCWFGDPDAAAVWVDGLIDECRSSTVAEVRGLGRVLKQWRGPILAWHTTGASNGPTESLNSIIKKIKRIGAGFTNFRNYRTRILLAIGGCDWTLIGLPA